MKKCEAIEKAIKIEEIDLHDGLYRDVWDGTEEVYFYNDTLYFYTERKNRLSYNGATHEYFAFSDVKEHLKEYNYFYWKSYLTKSGYCKLCEICGVEPDGNVFKF